MLTVTRVDRGFGLGALAPADFTCSASGVCSGQTYAATDKLVRLQRELIAWGAGITPDGKIGAQTVTAFKAIVPLAAKKMPVPADIAGLGVIQAPTPDRVARFADELRTWLAAARVYVAPIPASAMVATTPTIKTTSPVRLAPTVIQMTAKDMREPSRYGWWVAGGLGLAALGLFVVTVRR
jgi:hypothetical protein